MSDMILDIDSSQVVVAKTALGSLSDSWASMVTRVVSENKKLETAVKASSQVQMLAIDKALAAQAKTNSDAAFARDRRKIQMMDASAAMSRKQAREAEVAANAVVKASNEVVIAANKEARELERLKVKYQAGYAASALYNRMQAEIKRAHEVGAISKKKEALELGRLSAEYEQFQTNGAAAGNRFAGAAQGATRRMSSMGVVTQQVGYQVGDFAVQVQSGQSALVAFSQQATQLVGVLPLMSDQLGMSVGKLVGLSAVLGIGIPVVTGLVNVLFKAQKQVKTFKEALDEATSSLDEYVNLAGAVDDTIADSFELATNGINATSEAYQDLIALAKIDAFNNIVGLNDSLIESARNVRYLSGDLEDVQLLLSATPEEGTSGWFINAAAEAREFNKLLDDLDNADGLQNRFLAATALKESFISIVGTIDNQTEAQQEFTRSLSQTLYTMELMGAATGDETEAQKLLRENEEERQRRLGFMNTLKEIGLALTYDQTEAERDDLANAESMLATMQAENDIQLLINGHGKDSTQVATERAEQERQVYAAMVEQLQVLPEIKADLMEAYDASVDLASGLDDVGDRARDAARGVMSILGALKATLRELDAQEAGLAAAQGVINSGGSEIDARVIQAGIEFEMSAPEGLSGAELQVAVSERMESERRRLQNEQSESDMFDVFNTSGTSGGGSGGSQAADKLDFVQALEAEMSVRGELVKLYGAEYELQSEIARIVKGLGEDSGDYNAKSIEALAQQNLLLIEQENLREESVKQMQNVYDMLGNEIGSFTTAMISDTKSVEEAFKSMAKNIIDQLIQIFIVEQMVNSISGGLGGGGGGILSGLFGGGGGSKVKGIDFRAGGGPVTAGMPYIVGENEPELFVPNTSGNIYNQKQMANMGGNGSGDNVVIHQSFNFQANGDDTVKRLIQQAAPQIAQMTKSSMLNDRRRGGQTKSVFG
jgi:hypothetical protein